MEEGHADAIFQLCAAKHKLRDRSTNSRERLFHENVGVINFLVHIFNSSI